ncbi:PI31 proteasome regulator N-terminal-domain-containing protein [Glomus cerebriforme]|uniref:PI31 proteasome regulator N-terminal-domain-containing protein n=1 Tax=Glomus cerebriforme TaxID=658196 RepID=A0A397STN9_9GLOM|nr:PI31 proteasome regulator N-terminal-domain-containing protein [Glomus cerebriforme]
MSQNQNNESNVLAPEAVLSILDTIIKPTEEGISTILGSSHDALAALSHSIMQAVGFRLVGLDVDNNIIQRDSEGNIVSLPKGWNVQGPNSYAFRYKHPQSSFTFLIKCMRMSNKFIIHGMGIEDSKTATLELITDDYTSPSFFPFTAEKYNVEPIVHGFISTNRIKDMINIYKINIVQRLIPGLNKPGYEETGTTYSSTRQQDDPLRVPTRQPPRFPPIFDEPYGGDEPSGFNPFNIGRDDLDPLGSNPIYGPPRFGGSGGIPPLGGPSRGGGMFVGPDHPIFGQQQGPTRGGIYGGPQPLPRGSVPPGARFDPIGPFIPGPRGRGFGRGGPASGEPDNDELPPPVS